MLHNKFHAFVTIGPSVPWKMERCCHYVDDLCRHEEMSTIFPSSTSLLPPGVALSMRGRGVAQSGNSKGCVKKSKPGVCGSFMVGFFWNRIPPPSLSELDKTYSEMRSLFHEKQLELERVMEEVRSDRMY